MSVLGELAAFVQGASAGRLPEAERATLRRHVADTLLAAVAGAQTTEGRALRKVVPCISIADCAGMIAAVIRHTEIDDIHTRSCTTPSSVTVPAALALAVEHSEYDPDTVASAIWIGTELMARLGVAIDGARILYRGLWPTYFTAPLGTAAIASRMLRLSEEQTAHALSLALMLSAGRSGRFHGALPGRSVILAMAAANGIRAAQAAKDGVGGDPALLDGPWLKDAQGIDAKVVALTSGLGSGSIYREMTIKPFCSAKQAIAAVEAFTAVIDGGVAPDAIEKVVVRVPPPYSRMVAMKPEAGVRASTIVSAPFQIGLAAYRRERLYDIERADAMDEKAALALAGKTEIVADEALAEFFPATFPAEVEVTADGKSVRQRVTAANGDPGRQLDDAALADKARRILGAASAEPVQAGLDGFKSVDGCKRMADTLWQATMD
ncbi:MAG: MmgE/PrpD family protein [Xanthobacteraceae bacterium]|nr:MmgE/PrpD family protein [Xanthobacteraceae bacterium]